MTRQTNAVGLDLIKRFEAFRPTGYLPTAQDRPTAGWGHTGADVAVGVTYPVEQCEAWLRADLAEAERAVNDAVTAALSDNAFAACVSLAFNIGGQAFSSSTLCRMLNALDFAGAADQFLRWNRQAGTVLPGLTRRREAERALFLTPDESSFGAGSASASREGAQDTTRESAQSTTRESAQSTTREGAQSTTLRQEPAA